MVPEPMGRHLAIYLAATGALACTPRSPPHEPGEGAPESTAVDDPPRAGVGADLTATATAAVTSTTVPDRGAGAERWAMERIHSDAPLHQEAAQAAFILFHRATLTIDFAAATAAFELDGVATAYTVQSMDANRFRLVDAQGETSPLHDALFVQRDGGWSSSGTYWHRTQWSPKSLDELGRCERPTAESASYWIVKHPCPPGQAPLWSSMRE